MFKDKLMKQNSAYLYKYIDKHTHLPKTIILEEIPAPPIEYLLFEGAGVRGSAYGGVIQELECGQIISAVKHVGGASIGAIAAMLIAIGYTAAEINHKLDNILFSHYLEAGKPWPFTPNIFVKGRQYFTILTTKGNSLSSGNHLIKWLEDVIEEKLGAEYRNATFGDLAKLIKERGDDKRLKYLSVAVTNLSKNRSENFNHETTPDVRIATAVRMSVAFPGMFRPIECHHRNGCDFYILPTLLDLSDKKYKNAYLYIKETAQLFYVTENISEEVKVDDIKTFNTALTEIMGKDTYKRLNNEQVHRLISTTGNLNVFADGGIANNLPANFFNDEAYLPTGYGFTKMGANPAVLCVKVDTDDEMKRILWNADEIKRIQGFTNYSRAVLDCMQSREKEIYDQFSTNIIQVYDHGVSTLNFNLTAKEKKMLTIAGREAALQWLQSHVSEAYEIKTYNSEEEWLAAKSLEEIKMLQDAYKNMLQTMAQSDDLTNQLKEKILWFDKYFDYRVELLRHPKEKINFLFTPHIDLKPIKPRQAFDEYIKEDLNHRLVIIEREIDYLEVKIKKQVSNFDKVQLRLHNSMDYDQIIYVTKLIERLKFLKRERIDFRNKLNLPAYELFIMSKLPQNIADKRYQNTYIFIKEIEKLFFITKGVVNEVHINDIKKFHKMCIEMMGEGTYKRLSNKQVHDLIADNGGYVHQTNVGTGLNNAFSKAYEEFYLHLQTAISRKQSKLQHSKLAMLIVEQLSAQSASFQSPDGILINFDLKNPEDLKSYVMACSLYMKYINGKGELVEGLNYIYKKLFFKNDIPKKLYDMGVRLGTTDNELLLTAYRIETILKNLILLDKPKEKSVIDIDCLFDMLSSSKLIQKKLKSCGAFEDQKDCLEMEFLYDYEQTKFLLFPMCENTVELENKRGAEPKLPKCFKRLDS